MSERFPSTYSVLAQHGVDRRTFFKYCTSLAALMGLEATMVPKVVAAMENKPRIPVIWLHGLECTCCSESFIRSSHPIAQDILLNMISLDYDDTLQAAAGDQVEEIRRKIMKDYKGQYLPWRATRHIDNRLVGHDLVNRLGAGGVRLGVLHAAVRCAGA